MRFTKALWEVQDSALDLLHSQQNKAAGSWMDTILNLIPGRKQQSANEPSEEAIKRTHDFLRQVAILDTCPWDVRQQEFPLGSD